MSAFRSLFTNSDGLHEIITKNPANAYLMADNNSRTSEATPKNPMPLLHYWSPYSMQAGWRDRGFYKLFMTRDWQIVGALTLYTDSGIEQDFFAAPSEPRLTVGAVCTHLGYRNRGFAKACLTEAFRRAKKLDVVLALTSFEPEGRHYLSRAIPAIHAKFPDVRVDYPFYGKTLHAKKPYRIIWDKRRGCDHLVFG